MVVISDELISDGSIATSHLQFVDERYVAQERLLVHLPRYCKRREVAEAVVRTEPRRSVRTERSCEQVAVLESIIRPSQEGHDHVRFPAAADRVECRVSAADRI